MTNIPIMNYIKDDYVGHHSRPRPYPYVLFEISVYGYKRELVLAVRDVPMLDMIKTLEVRTEVIIFNDSLGAIDARCVNYDAENVVATLGGVI